MVSPPRAFFTAWRESPWASSFWGSTWTRISRVLPPTGSTLPTPGMFSMRRLRKSSAMRVSSRSFMSGCFASGFTTRESTGSWAGSNLEMTGSSMLPGRSRRIWPIFVRTSLRALSTLRPSWNWMTSVPRPSWLVELISLIFSMGLTASSIFRTTSCLTDSGLAPG